MRQGIALLLAALALAGCARSAVKAYDGPDRPAADLARLQGGASGDEMSALSVVEFASIDGRRHSDGTYVASVLPGSHTIGVKQTLSLGRAKRVQYCAFNLDTAPGCAYTPQPPSLPPPTVASGPGWEWSVELPVGIECGGGSSFMLRMPARCGSADRLLDERSPR